MLAPEKATVPITTVTDAHNHSPSLIVNMHRVDEMPRPVKKARKLFIVHAVRNGSENRSDEHHQDERNGLRVSPIGGGSGGS